MISDDICDNLLFIDGEDPEPGAFNLINSEEMVREQHGDPLCTRVRAQINGGANIPYGVSSQGYLGRLVRSFPQIVVSHSLQSRVQHLSHFSKITAHPGARRLYMTLRRDLYWPALVLDCYTTVKACTHCDRERVKSHCHAKKLNLFPPRAPVEFIAIEILREFLRITRGNRFSFLTTDRFSKLVWTVPLKKINARIVAEAFMRHWFMFYGPLVNLPSHNGL